MMSDKQKRKEQPINLKRYWLVFGLLALVLMIPFRIINEHDLSIGIYVFTTIVVAIVLQWFIKRIGWQHPLTVLIVACLIVPIFQVEDILSIDVQCSNTRGFKIDEHGRVSQDVSWAIFEPIECIGKYANWSVYGCTYTFLAIRHTPILIDIPLVEYLPGQWGYCG